MYGTQESWRGRLARIIQSAYQTDEEAIVVEVISYTGYQAWCRGLEGDVLATFVNSVGVLRGLPHLSMVCQVV